MGFGTNEAVALDVSSKNLTSVVAIVKAGKLLSLKQVDSVPYSGFYEGEWLDENELKEKAYGLLQNALKDVKGKRKVLHVSVPAEFLAVNVKGVSVEYDRVRKITSADLDYFYYKGDTFGDGEFIPINASDVAFSLDGGSNTTESPIGEAVQKIAGEVSYVFCEKSYFSIFDELASKLGFKETHYYATPLCEGLNIFEKEERFNELLLIDVGYLSTSVSVMKGNGLMALRSFSYGLGHVAANVYEALEIPFDDASELIGKIDLNLNYTDEIYETKSGYKIYMADVASIVIDSLRVLSATIKDAIVECGYIPTPSLPFYVTGEGLELKGITKYLERGLIKELEIVAPKNPAYNKPQNSSAISLINIAVGIGENRAGRLIYN